MGRRSRRSRRGGVVPRGKIRNSGESLSSPRRASLRTAVRDPTVKESLSSLFVLPRAGVVGVAAAARAPVAAAAPERRGWSSPPNVFRVAGRQSPDLFFMFEQPNNNDAFRTSDAVPISVFDPRPSGSQPSYRNLLRLLELVGLAARTPGQDPFAAGLVHVTNAVKCDKCTATGKTGRVEINERQVKTCVDRFLLKELSILRPKALVCSSARLLRNTSVDTRPPCGCVKRRSWVTDPIG